MNSSGGRGANRSRSLPCGRCFGMVLEERDLQGNAVDLGLRGWGKRFCSPSFAFCVLEYRLCNVKGTNALIL